MTAAGSSGSVVALDDGGVLLRRGAALIDVQLHRPEKRNAITAAMVDALHEVLDIADEEKPPVVVLRGIAGCFSAGADIAVLDEDLPRIGAEGQKKKKKD